MIQTRLFTFGCSFTQYQWPTWADILGREFDLFENWGMCAGGNQFILNSLIECNLRNKLQKTDTVIIMWSSITRLDRYFNHGWHPTGNFLHPAALDNDNHIRDIYDYRGLLIRDLAVIEASARLLESIGCNYQFHSMIPIDLLDQSCIEQSCIEQSAIEKYSNDIIDVLDLYKNTINRIKPSVYTTMYNNDWSSLNGVDISYAHHYPYRRSLEDFQENYNIKARPNWPLYDDFIKNNLTKISTSVLDELKKFDLYNKYTDIIKLNKMTSSRLQQILDIFSLENIPKDYHPLPNIHLNYIQKAMLEFNISNETIAWTNMHHDAVIDNEIIRFDRHQPQRL